MEIHVEPVSRERHAPGRLLLRPEEGADVIGVSRSQFYELLADGRIRSLKVGRLRRIPVAEIERFITNELEVQCA
jgi:excisionase family DNA binding protein